MEPVTGTCSRCGMTLAADAPLGLCPRCLLAAAVPRADSLGLDTLGVSSAIQAALAGESRLAQTASTTGTDEAAGNHIGPYKLLQKIGEGGMGVVYMAEQERPVIRRVAIKIIKLGMDTKQVIARFEAERQALALMDHPNIARVLDAGATDMGRPYFVMELVRGVSITEYCDSNNLTTRQRLELFLPVCRAVQHAHQKGIIHRDLKPSNVLITMHDGVPVPKVIDFGISKATSGRLTDKTLFTEYRQLVGTPEYMSPEQAEMSGLDIDTRADVYGLGVLLYELLTGTTPFDAKTLRRAAYAEIQRIIREVEPPKPSTRITSLGESLTKVAAHRGIDARKLSALIRGDLDWIVMKCLEKDRTRRYETANELGAEIDRHLNNEAVLARPTSAAYRVRKFVRRHRVGVAAAAAIVFTLLLGIIGTTYGLLRAKNETVHAKKETDRATREADKATAVTDFVQEMLSSANSMTTSRHDITVREVIDEAARKLDSGSLKEQAGVESAVRYTLGLTYNGLGKLDEAEVQLYKSLALAEQVYGPESPQAGSALASLGSTYSSREKPEAIELIRRSLQIRQKCFGTDSIEAARSLIILAAALHTNYDDIEAEKCLRQALQICRTRHNDKLAASVLVNLGNVLRHNSQFTESLAAHQEALDIHRKLEGEKSLGVSSGFMGLANTLLQKGDLQGSDENLTRAIGINRKILPIKHPAMKSDVLWLADVRLQRRDYVRAADLLLEVHRSLMQSDADDPQKDFEAKVTGRLAQLYNAWPNQQEAEHWKKVWLETMQARLNILSADIAARKEEASLFIGVDGEAGPHGIAAKPELASLLVLRAKVYSSLGKFDEAASDLATVKRIDPFSYGDWYLRSCLLAYMKDSQAYADNCRLMLEKRFKDHDLTWSQELSAKACLLLPQAPVDLKRVIEVLDSHVTARRSDPWFQITKGLVEYRLGHYQHAIDWCTLGRDACPEFEEKIQADLIIAMASHQLGHKEQAQAALANRAEQIDKDLPHLGTGDLDHFTIHDWFICQLLLKEANDLILRPNATRPRPNP